MTGQYPEQQAALPPPLGEVPLHSIHKFYGSFVAKNL